MSSRRVYLDGTELVVIRLMLLRAIEDGVFGGSVAVKEMGIRRLRELEQKITKALGKGGA